MQGARLAFGTRRGCRAATTVAVLSLGVLIAPAAASAHIFSKVVAGKLIATSDGGADILKLSSGGARRVKVDGLDPTLGPAPCSAIRRVLVLGRGNADTINVSRVGPRNGFSNRALRKPLAVRAFGGASSDRISGSRLSDLLSGGIGHDVLRGRAGADLLRGGGGSDRLLGGRGPDRLIGGRGQDFLLGGRGNDVLIDL